MKITNVTIFHPAPPFTQIPTRKSQDSEQIHPSVKAVEHFQSTPTKTHSNEEIFLGIVWSDKKVCVFVIYCTKLFRDIYIPVSKLETSYLPWCKLNGPNLSARQCFLGEHAIP